MPELQLIKVEDVFVKVETTPGTDAVPTGPDAVKLLGNGTLVVGAEIENARPELQNLLLDDAAPLPVSAKFCELSLRGQVRGLGATYTTTTFPELHAVIQSGGFSTAFAAAAWTYDTITTGLKTVTAYCFHGLTDGAFMKHALLAGRASSLGFHFVAGRAVEWAATIRGIFVQPSDTANITPTYQSTDPPLWQGAASWVLNGLSPEMRRASVVIPQSLTPRINANATDALSGYQPTGRAPTFEADFAAAKIADLDAFTEWKNATARVLAIKAGAVAGNTFNIDADKAVLSQAPTYRDDGGLWLYGASGTLHPEGTKRVQLKFS
jgi:hypothetical protein